MRVRITFSKRDALRYTGHLDLHKIWERTARRAGLPLLYSKGFHPQPKLSLAAALPLGFSSAAEILDLRLADEFPLEHIRARLNDSLPGGIRVLRVDRADETAPSLQSQVVAAEYLVSLIERLDLDFLQEKINTLLLADSLPRQRRGKSYNLRPLIEDLKLDPPEAVHELDGSQHIFMRLSAREGATGRPEEVLEALAVPLEITRIERKRLIFSSL